MNIFAENVSICIPFQLRVSVTIIIDKNEKIYYTILAICIYIIMIKIEGIL